MRNSEIISVKDLIQELKDIKDSEDCLRREDDTFEYQNREKVRLSSKLRDLMLRSQLSEKDFLTLKNSFYVTTKLNEKLNTKRFFIDEELSR